MLEKELKLCPFCGSDKCTIGVGEWGDNRHGYYVECEKCGSSSHMELTKEKTISLWNTRINGTY